MRTLITGIGGFVGRHLARHLAASGDEVLGLGKAGERPEVAPPVPTADVDVRDEAAVIAAVERGRPEAIVHLAALSHVGLSWERKREALEVSVLGALSVLEAARRLDPPPRLLLVGSAEEYGRSGDGPIDESAPLRPVSPYGAGKAAQELLGLQFALAERLPVVLVRAFNHSGPGQAPIFVLPEWARKVAEIERGLRPPLLEVGDIDVERDFTDVRDIVVLYRLLLEKGRVGEVYNACSGQGQHLRSVLTSLQALARVPFEVRERVRERPSEVRAFVGRRDKVTRETGWEPRIRFEQTLRDVLDDWRAQLAT